MAIYECNRCGASEVLTRHVPDCCSICGGTVVSLDGETFDQAGFDEACYEAAALAYREDCGSAGSRTAGAFIGVVVSAAVLLGLIGNSNGMAACQAKHSFDTCFETLNR